MGWLWLVIVLLTLGMFFGSLRPKRAWWRGSDPLGDKISAWSRLQARMQGVK
jgi:hypothetical protein